MSRPVLILPSRVHSHEEFLLVYGSVLGLVYLTGLVATPPPIAALGVIVAPMWALTLLTSGAVGLVGCRLRSQTGLRLEQAGMLLGAGALVLYVGAVLLVAGLGWRVLLSAGLILAWVVANLTRAAQIRHRLREGR